MSNGELLETRVDYRTQLSPPNLKAEGGGCQKASFKFQPTVGDRQKWPKEAHKKYINLTGGRVMPSGSPNPQIGDHAKYSEVVDQRCSETLYKFLRTKIASVEIFFF